MQMQEYQAIRSEFYEANTNYMGVLSIDGSVELYDTRNFHNGPVVIYNGDAFDKLVRKKELEV